VNSQKLAALAIPSPSLPEQQEIVQRVESALSWLDDMNNEYVLAANLLPKLDQAILAKAFCGNLVPQDPSDEAATELLARIRSVLCALLQDSASTLNKEPSQVGISPLADTEQLLLAAS
jgi:type I restriction enzyme, S subunit